MKILFVASEATPYFKSGGLGDVAGSLSQALIGRGHDVRLAMPRYRFLDVDPGAVKPLMPEMLVDVDGQTVPGAIDTIDATSGRPPVYLVRCDRYFDRAYAYCEPIGGRLRDYSDNLERFGYFSMAVIWMLRGLHWQPDIIHCNDWQTALVPVYLRSNPLVSRDPFYDEIKVVYCIHNLAFQGVAMPGLLPRIGRGPDAFSIKEIAHGAGVNLMKGAILLADSVTTVSRRYAREIQTPEFGCGLDGLLREQGARLIGIVNGIDQTEWGPDANTALAAPYSAKDMSGKAACKSALQEEFGLPRKADAPLIGMVSRLTPQKGFELVDASLTGIVERGGQIAVLGDGEPRYHRMLERMRRKYPDNVSARLTFDRLCSHRVTAGADLFMMPSYYEPCGLNQMFGMRYGTPPIVRRTGGLADTVVNCSPSTLKSGEATGFVFGEFTPRALLSTVTRAFNLYRKHPTAWRRLMRAGMRRDSSWRRVAGEYEALYHRLADKR